jgi:hypothetical protein
VSQGDRELESREQRATELESEARSYESAADQAAGAGQQRRARHLLQSARASRKLAAEIRRQMPALVATLKERTDAARRRLAPSATQEDRRRQRQAAEQEWVVRRWLRRLREP